LPLYGVAMGPGDAGHRCSTGSPPTRTGRTQELRVTDRPPEGRKWKAVLPADSPAGDIAPTHADNETHG